MAEMSHKRVLLTGGNVLDPLAGEVSSADVVISQGLIAEVGTGLDGDESVDCSGLTLAPGLIDCHAHMAWHDTAGHGGRPPSYRLLAAIDDLRATLQLGVTTVRDAWGADAGLRDAIEDGLIEGPRLLVSLAQLCGTAGIGDHFSLAAGELDVWLGSPWLPKGVFDGRDEARGAVRRMVRSGADVIKVAASGSVTQGEPAHHLQVAEDELAAIVAEAARHGKHVMAHAHGARAAEASARAGARSIEHGVFLDAQAVEAMAGAGTWLVPTLSTVLAEPPGEDAPGWAVEAAEAAPASFRMAMDAGVRIAMGTDCPVVPHANRLVELSIMQRLGMPPIDVWRSATSEAAELLDRGDLGLIEAGRRADVVAVSGDPWDLDGLAGRVEHVWKDGRAVANGSG